MSRALLVFALALLMLIAHVHAAYAMATPCLEQSHSGHQHDGKQSRHADACAECSAASIATAERPLFLVAASRSKYFDPHSPPLSAAPHELYRPPVAP